MNLQALYTKATISTANNLRTVARSPSVSSISQLTLPEIDAVVDEIARILPAGNVPGIILSGLARLPERKPPLKTIKRDINLLFKGVEQTVDKAVYGAFFAGPAAVIWGYQNLLRLAGKDPSEFFSDGTWQFYADYALRQDTARHANETHGFATILKEHNIKLSIVDRITAWVMTGIHCLHQYDDLLANEWRERVYTRLLQDVTANEPDAARYARVYAEWLKQLPYKRGDDAAPHVNYPAYRREKFDAFLQKSMRELRADLRHEWERRAFRAAEQELSAYRRQMTILAYLEPDVNGEERVPINLEEAHIGVVYRGHYYLIPITIAGSAQPPKVDEVQAQIAALVAQPAAASDADLTALAKVRRDSLPALRGKLSESLNSEIEAFRHIPIIMNFAARSPDLPLAEIRRAERGIGNHALTLFDTGETMVFDQSHIFFDGIWGAALAEIMTNSALSWAVYLASLPTAHPASSPPAMLDLEFQPNDVKQIAQAPRVTAEVDVENAQVDLEALQALRKMFKRRNDLLQLTVSDLLVLYRAVHAVTYEPSPALLADLETCAGDSATRSATSATLTALDESHRVNPVILIPVDACRFNPRDRIYPMTFEVPLGELNLLNLHEQVLRALDTYENARRDRGALFEEFDKLQRKYLVTLAAFGIVLSRAKEIAIRGESTSASTIKLLAHMPTPLQRMLDNIPNRFDVLNDIIKGREVFSNIGAVSPNSTLTRFITAKDDNEKKTLAWGIITDAEGVMRISLRDFRPHVALLQEAGCHELAKRVAQDYLDAYVNGLNRFVLGLRRITKASRETKLSKPRGKV